MKKLITLLLVLTGMVSTASADWYVAGDAACTNSTVSWTVEEANKMEDDGSGMYKLVVQGKSLIGSSNAYEFKITDGNGNWYGWTDYKGDEVNAYFTPHITGTYNITYYFDPSSHDVWEPSAFLTDGPDIYLLNNKSWVQSNDYKFTNTNGKYTLDVDVSDISSDFYFRFAVDGWDKNCGPNTDNEEISGGTMNGYHIVLTDGSFYGDKNFKMPIADKPLGKVRLTLEFVNRHLVVDVQSYEKVTTNTYGYCTFVNNYPLTIPATTAYYAVDNGNGSATAHAITDPAAGTPMVISATTGTYYFAVASSGTTYSDNAFKAGPVDGLASNPSEGIFNYILNGDTFKAANGKNVGKGKAYLQLSKAATARPLIFEGEDVTGISQIENGKLRVENYFNLAGQRVAQPTKGLYIVNGKKVLVK
jgi:hypothetical protein